MQKEEFYVSDDMKKSLYLLKDLIDSILAMNKLNIIFQQSSAHDAVLSKHLENVIQEKITKLSHDFSDFYFALGMNNPNDEQEP